MRRPMRRVRSHATLGFPGDTPAKVSPRPAYGLGDLVRQPRHRVDPDADANGRFDR
jgi:hypothetical protein